MSFAAASQDAVDHELRDGFDKDCTVERAERLDKALSVASTDNPLYGAGIKRLRRLCRILQYVPESCMLENVVITTPRPLFQTALSDVYQGAYGSIRVAVKSLRMHATDVDKVTRNYRDEVTFWKHLRHENIVSFLGISTILPVCIVSEWMENGNLVNFLVANPNADRHSLAKDVLVGVCFMHFLKLVHGDLKCVNVLVDSTRRARLTDFGLSNILHGTMSETATAQGRGTIRWMAPELLGADNTSGADSGADRPTKASDVYAVGMVLYEIFTGRVPFYMHRDFAIICDILFGSVPLRLPEKDTFGLSNYLWEIMVQCWSYIPTARPSIPEVLDRFNAGHAGFLSGIPTEVEPMYNGTYEIVSSLDNSVLGISQKTCGMSFQYPHGGDSQRWNIHRSSHRRFSLQNVASNQTIRGGHTSREFYSCNPKGVSLMMVSGQDAQWDICANIFGEKKLDLFYVINPALGRWKLAHMSDGATQYPALIHVDNVKPSVYVKSSSFIFRKDHTVARHASGIYGQHSLTNHKDGSALRFSEVTSLRDIPEGDSNMEMWDISMTARGYALRSLVSKNYLTPEAHRPQHLDDGNIYDVEDYPRLRDGMALRTGEARTSWWLQPVQSQSPDTSPLYRLCWPDGLFAVAIGPVSDELQDDTHSLAKTRHVQLMSTKNDGPHMHWRLVPHAQDI